MPTLTVDTTGPALDATAREQAVLRLKKKRDFRGHLLVYTLVNSCLVIVWIATGGHGFFWPMFPMVFWGIGVVMNAWDVYRGGDFSEEQIQREVRRLR